MINPLQQSYATQQTVAAVSRNGGSDSTVSVKSSDTVNLSGSGRLVADFFAGLGVEYAPGQDISLADLENGLQQGRQELEDDIRQAFLSAGIPFDPPVVLASDETGAVKVQGDHAYKEQIEALFASDSELSGEFRQVSGLAGLVDAGNEYVEFSKKYAKDPYGAVAEYAHLFDGSGGQGGGEEDFTLSIGPATEQSTAGEQAAAGPGEVEAVSGSSTARHAPADFTNMTRQEMVDWVNGEITGGRLSVKESMAFIALTIKFDPETGTSVPLESDMERVDFIEMAQNGLDGALWRNDAENAESYRAILEIMRSTYDPSASA